MELVDTHCHLDLEAFDADREQVLERARRSGVRRLLVPAVDAAHWDSLLRLCRSDDCLYPALGLHPVFLQSHRSADIASLASAVRKHRPVAIGETGLDYFVRELDRAQQQSLFEAQLDVARKADLPVVLHVRKAHDQVLSTLRRIPVPGGTVHAFNGSLQQAQQYIDMGFKLGFGGTMTYPRSSKIRQLAGDLPVDAIVLETDAPDMTVAAHQGERNSPEYLPDCLLALAEVRGAGPDELAQQTTHNACSVFSLGA
ncbi:MAG: TatD family hydrolase [Thiogranum sp.]